ncbi:hypothetical protein H8959_021980 [Pygathrix nigripes]
MEEKIGDTLSEGKKMKRSEICWSKKSSERLLMFIKCRTQKRWDFPFLDLCKKIKRWIKLTEECVHVGEESKRLNIQASMFSSFVSTTQLHSKLTLQPRLPFLHENPFFGAYVGSAVMTDETSVVSSPPPYTAYAAPAPEVGRTLSLQVNVFLPVEKPNSREQREILKPEERVLGHTDTPLLARPFGFLGQLSKNGEKASESVHLECRLRLHDRGFMGLEMCKEGQTVTVRETPVG